MVTSEPLAPAGSGVGVEHPFAAAMMVAPVTDWRLYDSVYTERFMDTPQHNLAGYDRGSVLKRAANMAGRPLLLCHGTGDDNVHMQQSVELVDKLVGFGNTDFELMIYPNRQHGISVGNAKQHIYRYLWQWLGRTLAEAETVG